MNRILLAAALGFWVGCSKEAPREKTSGMIDVPGGQIFYEITNPDSDGIPLLLIHGGPGSTSCYFGLLDDLITNRPVIRYDQLDTGKSDRPGDRSRWVLPHFVEEIEAIRATLNLDELHILGSSWGGTVAAEYGLEGNMEGVQSIIFAGPLLSTPKWMEDAQILISQMPIELQETIRTHESAGTYTDPAYVAATDSFYARYLYHQPQKEVPECAGVDGNSEMYNYMWGPTEFTATGTLLAYDRTDRLHEITLPVLFIAGEFDEARPSTLEEFARLMPKAEVEVLLDAGHLGMVDLPEEYAQMVNNYLTKVEGSE
ncbi:MAG: proline iminopeptidase-family hydrolase [Bacteroidetes bacterium]|nr:proline iminopeptidase-family hydrolase [Bacteroidota bacterium]